MAPGGLSGFVNRAASPSTSRPQSANSKRPAAASAKMPVPKTELTHKPVQQHTTAYRQPGSINNPAGQQNQGQRRDSGETINGRNDRYGTDAASSIDSTINERSMAKAEHGQRIQNQQDTPESVHSDDDDDDDDGYSETSGDSGGDEYRNGYNDVLPAHEYRDEAQQAIFAEINSYPSTTSGPPEDLNEWNARQQQSIRSVEEGGPRGPIPHRAVPNQAARQVQPQPHRASHALAAATTMPRQNMFERAAYTRVADHQSQSNAMLRERGGGAQMKTATTLSMQPQGHSQVVPQVSHPVHAAKSYQTLAPSSQIPQRGGAGTLSGTQNAPTTQLARAGPNAPGHATRVGQSQAQFHMASTPPFKEEPVQTYEAIEGDPVDDPEPPAEDYDTPALFNLSYDQLRDEDFDDEPRGKTKVIADDMQQRGLPERLVHVQKNFNPAAQDKFFRTLPTREWEDAGEWFLDQFSDIITRAKDARQNKRKLARDFEDEVEKRYRRVAKRQQNVETALDGMKTKGQGLIPKSPRASKEPVARTSRARKP